MDRKTIRCVNSFRLKKNFDLQKPTAIFSVYISALQSKCRGTVLYRETMLVMLQYISKHKKNSNNLPIRFVILVKLKFTLLIIKKKVTL